MWGEERDDEFYDIEDDRRYAAPRPDLRDDSGRGRHSGFPRGGARGQERDMTDDWRKGQNLTEGGHDREGAISRGQNQREGSRNRGADRGFPRGGARGQERDMVDGWRKGQNLREGGHDREGAIRRGENQREGSRNRGADRGFPRGGAIGQERDMADGWRKGQNLREGGHDREGAIRRGQNQREGSRDRGADGLREDFLERGRGDRGMGGRGPEGYEGERGAGREPERGRDVENDLEGGRGSRFHQRCNEGQRDNVDGQRGGPGRGRGQRGDHMDQNTARRGGYRAQENSRYEQTQGRYGKNKGNFIPLSSRLLIQILDKDPSEAATELGSLKGNLKAGLNEASMDEVRQYLFWKALAFVCGALGADETVIMLLTMVLDSKLFTQHILSFLTKLKRPGEKISEKQSGLLKNAITVLFSAMQSIPSRASDLKVVVTLIADIITGMDESDKRDDIMKSIKLLNNHIEDIEKERERKRQMDRISKNPPPDDFRQQDILPTVKELQAGYQPFLRPHLTRGVYADADHYLDVQFRLLKEDFIYPLRNGISEYLTFKKANPDRRAKLQDVRVYEDAHYEKSVHDFSGISHYMAFKKLPRVRWQSTKWLTYGSLLILSSDDFQSYIFATVAKRDVEDLENGLVAISLVDREDASCLLNKKYVMAESSVFFEAYRPVLLALQRMSGPCLPFSRYTLSMCHNMKAPEYLRDQMTVEYEGWFDISPLLKYYQRSHFLERREAMIDVLDEGAWPDIDDVKLDQSQYEAVKTALTKELSIIQGPPGTGKTYTGLKIVETLLQNRKVWSSKESPSPILIVCYTNHALDQFLEGILTFHRNGLVRVGSRSKSEKLKSLNLNRIAPPRVGRDDEYVQQRVRHVKEEVDDARRRVERIQAKIEGSRYGIINEDELRPFMSLQHYNTLLRFSHMKKTVSWLVEWLLCECQYNMDWKEEQDRVEERNGVQEEHERSPNQDRAVKKDTIEVDYERSAIESERMIDDEDEQEESDEEDDDDDEDDQEESDEEDDDDDDDDDEDYPFLGLDLNNLDKAEHGILRRFIQKKLSGIDVQDPRVLNSVMDVWSMHLNDRWALYHMWLKNYVGQLREKLREYELKLKQLCGQLVEAKDVKKYQILREATIIGMTTTGAANHQQVLQRVRPRIVIVEEAAEVLEAHIITALNASCQQLILIGDHQQLRPKPKVYLLAKKYHLDVSLFERLINNDFPYSQLELQHRMRIELSDLMRRHFYNNLHDHNTVKYYESVRAVQKDIFFIDHAEPEDEMEDTQSHYNLHEARLVVALCYYLLHQGYEPSTVTILTAYTGQLLKIKQMMDRSKFEGVKVTSIDNYQGEENDIILLSFVRSNSHGHIGFLGISNRVCVSLSRAKKGLYCFGNFTMYAGKSELWKGIVNDLKSTGSFGNSLMLQCTIHPDERTAVKTGDDFQKVPLGGCNRDCDTRLECGHVCRFKCHPTDRRHLIYRCQAPCTKVICERNHECPKFCSDPCPTSCSVIVEKLLPCSHSCKAMCKTDMESVRCEVKVDKTLSCSHVRLLPCHMTTEGLENECEVIINKELQCGHRKTEKCNGSGRCDEILLKVLKCNHTCPAECHEDPNDIRCKENVEKTLPCGHTHTLPCSTSIDNVRCNTITRKILSCGHEIMKKCCYRGNCLEIVEKNLPCGHKLKMTCSTDVETVVCKARCSKVLSCGHNCKERCGLDCAKKCTEMVNRNDWPCGHEVTVRCCEGQDACYIPCDDILICGHKCKGTCGECFRGRYHLPCSETCRKKLICGHECALKCGAPCTSCEKKCPRRCRHSQCKHPCSMPCDVCLKRCNWKCVHYECKKLCCEPCDRPPCNEPCPKKLKCGHPCIGLCGEICPNKCRICDKEELEQRFFGAEDVQKARYIQLEDCGHFFEVEELDKFLGLRGKSNTATSEVFTELSNYEISVKSCPKCEKPILLSRRYGNLLRESSMIKPRVMKKLQETGSDNENKQFIVNINSVIKSGREAIQYLSHKSSEIEYGYGSVLSTVFVRWAERRMSKNRPLLDKLRALLLSSTDALSRQSESSPNILTDQQALDLWTEMERVKIMCRLDRLLRTDAKETNDVPELLLVLERDSNVTLASALLSQIRKANGISSAVNDRVPTFIRSPCLSYEVSTWLACAKGHPIAKHQLKKSTCEDCDREKVKEEIDRLEATAFEALGHQRDPRQYFPRQQGARGQHGRRGRGRGRRKKGRGRKGGR